MDDIAQLQQKLISAEGTIRAYESEIESLRKGLLASSLDGVIITDPHLPDNPVTYVNHVFEKITGYTSAEVVGKNMRLLYGNDHDQSGLTGLREAINEGKEFRTVLKNYKKDGTLFWNEITLIPSFDNKGNLVSYIATMHDVTHERDVDRMKTDFISIASHQLRTPLTTIAWYTEMLLNGDVGTLSADQKEYVGYVQESTERMIELVNALLNISRIESGRLMIVPEKTQFKLIVDSILKELKPQIAQKRITVTKYADVHLPEIMADPKLLHQVYLNLITNSIKYTPAGGKISVTLKKSADSIVSIIHDTGYGIPKKDHDKIFQRFFRAENIVQKVTDGTGLGLYLVKAIIDSSKGKIGFESAEGKGTNFWFSIPLSGIPAKAGEVRLS